MLQGLPNPYGQIWLCLNPYIYMAQHTQNLNNTATRTVQGGLYIVFSGNKFGVTFNIKRVEESSTILAVTAIQALYNDVLYIHTGFVAIMSSIFLTKLFDAP